MAETIAATPAMKAADTKKASEEAPPRACRAPRSRTASATLTAKGRKPNP